MTELTLRILMATLLAGIALAGAPLTSLAQDAVVEKAALTKIVIAPPRSDLARIIKAGLQKAYYEADKDSRAYAQAQKLYFFYGARGFEPLWLTPGVGSAIKFSDNAEKIMAVFKDAELEGFRTRLLGLLETVKGADVDARAVKLAEVLKSVTLFFLPRKRWQPTKIDEAQSVLTFNHTFEPNAGTF